MRQLLKGQSFLVVRDSVLHIIVAFIAAISVGLVIYIGSIEKFKVSYILQPLEYVITVSLMLYLLIPIFVCFYSTEGFESRSILNVLASGHSRVNYIISKFITIFKVILWSLFQFLGMFLLLYLLIAIFTHNYDTPVLLFSTNTPLALGKIALNVLYLTAYASIILTIGMLIRNTAATAVITFVYVMGDFFAYGYLQESSAPLLRVISENTMMYQVALFSGLHFGNQYQLSLHDTTVLILRAIIIVVVCLVVSILLLNQRDIG